MSANRLRLTAALRRASCLVLLVIPLVGPVVAAEKAATFPGLTVGYEFTERLSSVSDDYPLPIPDPTATADNPLAWRLEVFWAEIEKQKGEYDWEVVSKLVDRFVAKGHEPILCLWGGNPLYSEEILAPPTARNEPYVQAWESFLRSAVRLFRGKVRFYEVWRNPNEPGLWPGAGAARQYAYLLKRSATVIRAEAGPNIAVITGGLSGADTGFLRTIFEEGVGPYLDVVALRPDAKDSVETQVSAVAGVIAEASPSTKVYVMGIKTASGSAESQIAEMARVTLESFGYGARLVTFSLPRGVAGWPDRAEAIARLHSVFTPGLGLLPASRAKFEDAQGAPLAGGRSISFLDPDKGVAVIGYYKPAAPAAPAAEEQVTVSLQARRPGPPVIYDPVAGNQTQGEFQTTPEGAKGTVPLRTSPLFLLFREGAGAAPAEAVEKGPEEVRVSAERGITAEEIITKHQEVSARQSGRLKNYIAKGMVQLHFGIGGSQRIDAAMAGRFFYDPARGQEWEFTDYFVNGNRSPWKQFPELPYIQPEKVVNVPLDISFDRSYSYELSGEDTVEGRDCWVLAFEPVDTEKSLYRGRVWIDKQTFNKVRMVAVQTRVAEPFVSSEDKSTYGPISGPEGEMWLLTRVDGQQIFSVAGRNLSVLREVTFEDFVINGAEFETQRQAAYQSEHQMMRDTEKGLRYLVKDETGERKVKDESNKNYLFGLAGIVYDQSSDYPLPLLGVNYFTYDLRGTGIQANVFFAGVLGFGNATKPGIWGTKYDLGVDAYGVAVDLTDREFEIGHEIKRLGVKRKLQGLSVNFGHPIGEFAKLRASAGLRLVSYARADDTARNFIVPEDEIERDVELSGTFDRAGYSVTGSASIASRSKWPFWGCAAPHDCGRTIPVVEWDPQAQVYMRYQLSGAKEWNLPYFQKARLALDWFDGSDLDRFSRYQFGLFGFTGPRLRGFGGTGVRFDDGVVAHATYGFNLGNVLRIDATLDQARVRDLSDPAGYRSHTGFGIGANLPGPWETVLQFDSGYALRSDIEDAEGSFEVLFAVLKLFNGKPRRSARAGH